MTLEATTETLRRIAEGRMTLTDALRVYGPKSGLPGHDRVVDEAGALLLEALTAVVRTRTGRWRDLSEDAMQDVLIVLQRLGPRGARPSDGEGDAWAVAYLRQALRNRVLKLLARAGRGREACEAMLGELEAPLEAWSGEEIDASLAALAEGKRRLLAEIGPMLAASMRGASGETLLGTLEQMRAVDGGERSPADLVDDEERCARGGRTRRQCANAVYARHSRAGSALRRGVDALRRRRRLTATEHACLCIALDDLRLDSP